MGDRMSPTLDLLKAATMAMPRIYLPGRCLTISERGLWCSRKKGMHCY